MFIRNIYYRELYKKVNQERVTIQVHANYRSWRTKEISLLKKFIDKFDPIYRTESVKTLAIPASEKSIQHKRSYDFYDEEETFPVKFKERNMAFDSEDRFQRENTYRR